MKRILGLSTIFLLAVPLASAPALAGARDMGCSPTLANPCTGDSGGGSGSHASGSELGTAIGQALGQAIGEAIRGNPEAEARRQAEVEAERRRVEEEIRQREEERKDRLLGGMIGVEDSPPLGLMGIESGTELSLMTGDQAEQVPTWDQYKAWEQYKRDVLSYQELVTKSQSENRENQLWCKGHIPLSMGPNSAHWESRCNPNGHVRSVSSDITPAPKAETATARAVVAITPTLKGSSVALINHDAAVKTAAQGGFDAKGPMLGQPGAVSEIPAALPLAAPPDVTQQLKDPADALASHDEAAKTAAQGGFDSTGPMSGKLSVVPKIPEPMPMGATPATAVAPVVKAAKVPSNVGPKKTPAPDDRQVMTGNQAVLTPKPASAKKFSSSAQQAVAEKQVQALSCAIGEFQELANGMGEGALLRAELKDFLANLRVDLSQPCSGQPVTHKVQTLSLSSLTKSAMKEDQLVGSLLMTRDEQSCEVRLHVQHASSRPGASSRAAGQLVNEGQSVIQMDKNGNILAAENPADVEKCLTRLGLKGE